MSFFRKLFGSDDKPAGQQAPEPVSAPKAPLGDPYRGDLYVEPAVRQPLPAQKVTPIWDSWTDVLALERSTDGPLPLASIVYCGEPSSDFQAVRRVTFVEGGVFVNWEHKLDSRDFLSNHMVGRVDDRVIVPRTTGLVAVHLATGEPCWELPHPAALYKAPVRYPDGDLMVVFHDQSWMKLHPRNGDTHEEGHVRSDVEAQELLDRGRPLQPRASNRVRYSGHQVRIIFDELRVERDDDATAALPDRYEPPAPSAGEYPIDEWKPDDYVDLVGDKLAVWLKRTWGDRTRVGIGLFEPTSLEPLRLIELADTGTSGFKHAYVVDDMLIVSVVILPPSFQGKAPERLGSSGFHATFAVDTRSERVLGCFAEGRPSFLFDDAGRQIWRGEI